MMNPTDAAQAQVYGVVQEALAAEPASDGGPGGAREEEDPDCIDVFDNPSFAFASENENPDYVWPGENPDNAWSVENPECDWAAQNPVFLLPEDSALPLPSPDVVHSSTDVPDSCNLEIEQRLADQRKMPGLRLLALLCLAGALEGADSVLLPCVFLALQRDLGYTLNNLAVMSMVQALAGNFAGPMWGVMADRGTLPRKTIIVMGCIIQGIITMAFGGVDQFAFMLCLRAVNGAMLASLRPIANGILADSTSEANQGKVFGLVNVVMSAGAIGGTFVGTNLARRHIFGLQGWRVAFLLVGAASSLVGFGVWAVMEQLPSKPKPVEEGPKRRVLGAVVAELRQLSIYFRMPTFCILILQGCFGTVPWSALSYKTLFFQLSGITDLQASVIDISLQVCGATGGLIGGLIGDRMSRCSKYHGRPITAQISVLCGIPLVWLIFMQHPSRGSAFVYYTLLMAALGITTTWCGTGVNLPILAKIVRDDRRATIMAWEGSLESAVSVVFGNAMVGVLAENVFGYDLDAASGKVPGAMEGNIRALGTALTCMSIFPWLLCFGCYTTLHWTYRRDTVWLRDKACNGAEDLDGKRRKRLSLEKTVV